MPGTRPGHEPVWGAALPPPPAHHRALSWWSRAARTDGASGTSAWMPGSSPGMSRGLGHGLLLCRHPRGSGDPCRVAVMTGRGKRVNSVQPGKFNSRHAIRKGRMVSRFHGNDEERVARPCHLLRLTAGFEARPLSGSLPGTVPAVQSGTRRRSMWHRRPDTRTKSGHEPIRGARPCHLFRLTAGLDPAVRSGMSWRGRGLSSSCSRSCGRGR